MYKLSVCCVSNKGKRNNNEDSFYANGCIPEEKAREEAGETSIRYEYSVDAEHIAECLAVFDGMGGMNAGEVASYYAAKELKNTIQSRTRPGTIGDFIEVIRQYAVRCNAGIYREARLHHEYRDMGSTFVGLCICDDEAVVLNIGDSRCYVLQGEKVSQLSTDHSRAAQDMRNGYITLEEYQKSPDRNCLTRHLGLNPDYGEMVCAISDVVMIGEGKRFMICSDGLFDAVDERDMAGILAQKPYNEAADRLLQRALENESEDNITVITAYLEKEAEKSAAPEESVNEENRPLKRGLLKGISKYFKKIRKKNFIG